jgi:hypothetical protein
VEGTEGLRLVGERSREFKQGSVVSKDGQRIQYWQVGKGPGVVVMHGTMESAKSHMILAESLSDAFTVYLPERRTRTLGFPFVQNFSIQKEVEDLQALLTETDSYQAFGVSTGAIVTLQTTLYSRSIKKAGLYEPPLALPRAESVATLRRFDEEMVRGRVDAAMITAMKGAQMGPAFFRIVPRWLLEYFTRQQIKKQQHEGKESDDSMTKLAVQLHYDLQVVAEMSERFDDLKTDAEVLLLGGGKSQDYLKSSLSTLERTLPHVKRVEFPGLDHGGSSDPGPFNRHGNPKLVAQTLRSFFAAS